MEYPPPDVSLHRSQILRDCERCRLKAWDSCGLALLDRKVHEKCCARTRAALNGDRSTVGLHRVFDDREAQTGATGVSRPVFVDAVETLENMRLVA